MNEAPAVAVWSGWAALPSLPPVLTGAHVGRPAVVMDKTARLQVFALVRGAAESASWSSLWRIRQSGQPDPPWLSWEPLGGPLVGDPVVATNWYGGLEVFGRGLNGTLWHIWQTDPANDQWSNWNDLGGGGVVGNPAVAANADGRWRCSSGPERSLAY